MLALDERVATTGERKSGDPGSPHPLGLAQPENIFVYALNISVRPATRDYSALCSRGPKVRANLTAPTPPARPRDRKPRGRRSHPVRHGARAADAELPGQLLIGPLEVVVLALDEFCASEAAGERVGRWVVVIC